MGSLYGWSLIYFEENFIMGPATIACGNFAVIPINNFFDKKGLSKTYLLSAFLNIFIYVIYAIFFLPQKPVIYEISTIYREMVSFIALLMGTTIYWVYFGCATTNLYDEMRNELEKLETDIYEKNKFFSIISKEIRNPLNNLHMSLEMLQDPGTLVLTSQTNLLKICNQSVKYLSYTFQDLFNMYELINKTIYIESKPINLCEIIENIQKNIRYTISHLRGNSVNLQIILDPKIPQLLILDAYRIEQIITTLLLNSVELTEKGQIVLMISWFPALDSNEPNSTLDRVLYKSSWKKVMVFSEKEDNLGLEELTKKYQSGYAPSYKARALTSRIESKSGFHIQNDINSNKGIIKIEVMDKGKNIPENIYSILLGISKNLDIENYNSNCLRLWITKRIVKEMNGDMKIVIKENSGNNIMLAIPTEVSNIETNFSSFQESPLNIGKQVSLLKGLNFLIYEPNLETSQVLKELLNLHSINPIIIYQKIENALEVFKSRTDISLIICDIHNQDEIFLSEIRKFENLAQRAKTPIILLTTNENKKDTTGYIEKYGINKILLKPIRCNIFMEIIERVYYKSKHEKNHNILIIDEDIVSAKFVKSLLKSEGHDCKICTKIKDAIEEFSENMTGWNIVLLGEKFSDGTGVDFMNEIWKFIGNIRNKPVFVCMCAHNFDESLREIYKKYNIEIFIEKPIKKQVLINLIQSI